MIKLKNILLCTLLMSSISYAEESMWNKVKSTSSSAWSTTKEKVKEIDSNDVKNSAKKGYNTTKEYGSKAWNYSKEKYNKLTEDEK